MKKIAMVLGLGSLVFCNREVALETFTKYDADNDEILTREEMVNGIQSDMQEQDMAGSFKLIEETVNSIFKGDYEEGLTKNQFLVLFSGEEIEDL